MAAVLVVCSLLTPWGAVAAPVAARVGECTIVGTPGPDVLIGGPGRDVICGRGGDDRLVGGGGNDELRGGPGRDVLLGRDGRDVLVGGAGADVLRGHGDRDLLRGGRGDDRFHGGPGNDTLRARDSLEYRDVLACGTGGGDRAFADPPDVVRANCEEVVQNDPPTDLTLTPSTVAENEPEGTDVGELTVADPDPGDTHVVALVAGDGDQDNASFSIDGSTLVTAATFDFETDPELTVRVRATDEAGAIYEESLSVSVTDVDENRVPVAVSDTVSTVEDTPLELPLAGAGSPAANDTDADGDPLAVTAVADAAGGSVSIAGGEIVFVPAANLCGVGAAGFTYTVADGRGGTDDGHVTVDVTCTPDDASAANDTATVTEDAPATALTVLANDSDPDGDPLTIASVTQPTHGTVVLTGGVPGARTGLTYEPDPGYCNSGGGPADTFTYTLNGGSVATVSVAVTCVDDAPVAVADAATVDEDAVATAVAVLTNDTDTDGGPMSVASVTQPDNGAVVITGGGSGLTYQPDANYCNDPPGTTPDTFDYTLNGGSTATVSVTVNCVDDDPVAVDDAATLTEDAAAAAVPVLANDTDVDGGPMSVASVTQPANGTVVITGAGSGLTYQPDANYCNDPAGPAPGDAPDTFDYTLNGGSTATVSVTVTCVDDAPTAVDDAATVTEDAAAAAVPVLANDTDVDGGPKTIASAGDPANGTVAPTGGVPGAHTGLTYQPDVNYCGSDTFTYALNGGSTATVSVTVTCVDDDPVAVDDSATLVKDAPATALPVLANDTDVDGGVKTIASAGDPANGTVVLTGGSAGAHTGLTYEPDPSYCNDTVPDTFTYTVNGGSTATVTVTVQCDAPPVAVDDAGTVAEDAGAAAIDVLANDTDVDGGPMSVASVTQPDNGAVVITGGGSGLTYQPDANYCNSGAEPDDTFTYTLNGGSTATVSVEVTCADDPPTAVDDAATVLEDAVATAVPVLANDTDVDGGTKSIGSATDPANGAVVITGGGTGLTYQPDPNYCNSGADPDDTFTYTLNGGSSATVSMTVTCVNDAPLDAGESQSATGNTRLEVELTTGASSNPKRISATGNLLDNATDVDDAASALSVDTATVSNPPHGDVSVNSNGSYAYTPDPGYVGADSFTYQVQDDDGAHSTARTVDITVGTRIWYVRADAAAGGDGRSETPFNALPAADAAANATGDAIYVFRRSGDVGTVGDPSLDLLADQRLLGSKVDLLDGATVLYDGSDALTPSLTGTSVKLDDANVVRGLDIAGAGAPAIDGGTGDVAGTLDQLNLTGNGGGINLSSTTGTFNVSDVVVNTTGGTGIALANAGTAVFAPSSQISVTTGGGPAIVASGTALGTSTFDLVKVTSSASGGVSLSNTTGTTTFGDGTGVDLDITTSGGTGILLSTAGTISVPDDNVTPTAKVASTNGPAVDISGSTVSELSFADVDSTGSAGDGINLANLGSGTFTAGTGSVVTLAAGSAGVGFDLDGGSGNVTYGGTVTASNAGRSVEVSNRTGGTVDLNGLVTDNGTGVRLTANTTGTVRFDGGLVASTGANGAFSATGGGTVVVTDPNAVGTAPDNTLTTTTGAALNVNAVTIGAAGLNFRSISSNGATNGIALTSTGASGGLTVSGNGGSCISVATCSGGVIQNATVGVSLSNTRDVSIDRMLIQNTVGDGIDGTTTTNFSFTNGRIDNSGTGLGAETSNIGFNTTAAGTENNLSGLVTITGNTLTNAFYHGIDIFNFAGTISNATISNNTITSTTSPATSKGGGVRLVGFGSVGGVANITTATLSGNTVTNFPSGFGIQVQGGNGNLSGPAGTYGSVGSPVTLTGNTVAGQSAANRMGTFALAAAVNGRGTGFFAVSGNTLSNTIGTTLSVSSSGFATTTATVHNNTITANNGFGSQGIGAGTGSVLAANETPTLNLTVTSNNISQTDGNGILLVARDAAGQLNVGVRDNTVAAPLVGVRPGIRVDAGNTNSTDDAVCLNISGNTSAGTGGAIQGIGLRKQGTLASTNDFGVEGMAATATPGVEAYVNALNPAGNGTLLISATSGFSGCGTAP